mmetsp:Transcript_29220/g.79752  ORF Transcript_29220/g.79752 Transcript_29220/m.79752 type:complete len:578 (-) Transcript_29220:551-2284(-)
MFAGQSDASHVHAGGDNRLTCSALLRLGQLVANSGWWHVDGAPRQLIGNDYMREWLTPQFPELNSAYGFLTWLNQPTLRPQDTFKRPGLGWCDVRTHGAWVDAGGEPVGAPDSLAMGAGWLAKYVFILPETRTVVVSIGQTWTRSAACQPPQNIWNYDEAYAAREVWRTIGSAITPRPPKRPPPLMQQLLGNYSLPPPRYGGLEAARAAWAKLQRQRRDDPWAVARQTMWNVIPGRVTDFALLLGTSAEVVAESAAVTYDQSGKPTILPTVHGAIAALGEVSSPPPPPPLPPALPMPPQEAELSSWLLLGDGSAESLASGEAGEHRSKGSCYCACPIDLGFGQCFSGRSKEECQALEPLGRDYCPAIGIVNQCAQSWPDCNFMPIILSWKLLQGNPLSCATMRPCPSAASLTTLSAEPRFRIPDGTTQDTTGTCECYAEKFVQCSWDARPNCGMRPGNGDGTAAILASAVEALSEVEGAGAVAKGASSLHISNASRAGDASLIQLLASQGGLRINTTSGYHALPMIVGAVAGSFLTLLVVRRRTQRTQGRRPTPASSYGRAGYTRAFPVDAGSLPLI